MIKQAVLLAAGLGTRLRPITDTLPKCLVPINEQPLLYIWLEQLYRAGVRKFVINTHYFSDKVSEAVAQHPYADLVTLVYEAELKGTAGTVKHLLEKEWISQEDTLVLHADNLCHCNWPAFFAFHKAHSAQVSMMSFVTDEPERCGILEVGQNNQLLGFHEKVANPPGNLANAAIYIFSAGAFEFFLSLSEQETDISHHLIPKILDNVCVWPTDGYIKDIGTPSAYQQALLDWKAYA